VPAARGLTEDEASFDGSSRASNRLRPRRRELGLEDDLLAPFDAEVAVLLLDLAGEGPAALEEADVPAGLLIVRLPGLELALDDRPHRIRMRVVNEEGDRPRRGLRFARGQSEESPGLDPGEDLEAVPDAPQGALFAGRDAGTWQDVVELGERQVLLGPLQLPGGVGEKAVRPGGDGRLLGGVELVLEPAVALLDQRHRGIAADGPGIEVLLAPGQARTLGLELGEIGVRRRVDDLQVAPFAGQGIEVGQVLAGRPAAVVADAPEVDDEVLFRVSGQPRLQPLALPASGRTIMRRGPVNQDFGAVVADPDELVAGKGKLPGPRPAAEIGRVPALGRDLDKAPGVAEGIEVDGRPGLDPELLGEIALAEQDLADERLAARHVAVGLDVPAAHDVPFPLPDEPADPAEQGRLVLLDPFVEDGLVVAEDEPGMFLAKFGGLTEGRQGLPRAFLPLPEPDRVEVGVGDEVDLGLPCHRASPCLLGQGPRRIASDGYYMKWSPKNAMGLRPAKGRGGRGRAG
jgi:hypothetical protein